ncbi:DDB1- and CUL4-associated factor 5 [Diachasma alloeum]|uniref:DDB1- and CUL4-associated factor 5 n=1 Tax=Diachasma alloeum TaxID=454923 RepID=UPI0007384317|nr:DDB1- and CUL4-associated factor 5 [Diachasma alloeum]
MKKMVRPSYSNPISCFLSRQVEDRVDYCKRLVDERLDKSKNLFRKDLLSHYGCVNAIEFLKDGDLIVSGGDDRRVLLWKVQQALQGVGPPVAMRAHHGSNIFCLGYDSSNSKIFSAGNDDQVIVHDMETGDPVDFFLHEKPVYGLSIHPVNDHVFASACDDGRVLVYDIREPSGHEPFCLAQYKTPFHSVMFNPVEPRTLATANAEEGVSLWDVRKPLEPVLRYGFDGPTQSCMNVRFNSAGTRLLALKRRLPPVLYGVDSPAVLCHFDQPGYYNSCTMKSCCFAGRDESYVLSGSDDFNLYVWKIPKDDVTWVESAHMILRGHRSIVNHVRYNPRHCILASSGVEKIIKVWSPFSLGKGCMGGLRQSDGKLEKQRRVFTHEEYLRLVLQSGQIMTHDYSHQSTKEDPRMMAFFDNLVQREIEGWGSEDTPSTHRSPSDSENTPSNDRHHNGTDSDDSTASDTHLMRSVLGAKTCSRDTSSGGVAPERPFGSPNRITRLIRSCRDKLLRLAALENGSIASRTQKFLHKSKEHSSGPISDSEESSPPPKTTLKLRLKGVKRKQSRVSSCRSKIRRKCSIPKAQSDSDCDLEPLPGPNRRKNEGDEVVDTTQPSTSTGVSSRGTRWSRKLSGDSDPGGSNVSSDEETTVRKQSGADGSGSNKRPGRCKGGGEGRGGGVNGARNDVTPLKRVRKVPPTPDSGIQSGLSTLEKSRCNGNGGSSDERSPQSIERFRKRVDSARRGYRKRARLEESASDSSD